MDTPSPLDTHPGAQDSEATEQLGPVSLIPDGLTTMDYRSTSSRRSVDFPKPETDLAEWTSKIKALQRQVDADEENEQRRLEEEIAAARQARLRRSSRAGRADSVDFCKLFNPWS